MTQRTNAINTIRERGHYPVVIVGAGVNGAGLFRDLSLQGVDCLLIDRSDFGAGTSAAPSRLIHGGLKYLETGEFSLVAESARERNRLLRNAPHYVKPLESMVPVYSRLGGTLGAALNFLGLSKRGFERGGLVLRLGLALYDWLGRHDRVMPRHRYRGRQASLATLPSLRDDIVGTGCYYDAKVTFAERLTLELVLDGLASNRGSTALNYAAAADLRDGRLVIADVASGDAVSVSADLVVNAGGPWIDHVNRALGEPTRYVGGSKGSHLVLDHPDLLAELNGRMVYFGASDGRICLAYPFFGRVLVGSTDIPVDDPDAVVCDDDEIDYMLGEVQGLFPRLDVGREHIIYHYVGVRPLPSAEGVAIGKVSRSHSVRVDEPDAERPFPVFSLIGGKWTTFRNFAEEVADDILEHLGQRRRQQTRNEPIGGGRDFPTDADGQRRLAARLAAEAGVETDDGANLLERYGTNAMAVATAVHQDGARRLTARPDYFRAEIAHLCAHEYVERLEDVLLRRTVLALTGGVDEPTVREIAAIAAETLGWDAQHQEHEIQRAWQTAATHGIQIEPGASSKHSHA